MLTGIAELYCARDCRSPSLFTITPSVAIHGFFHPGSPTCLSCATQAGALTLIGYRVPQRIWCSTHKSENPADVIDPNLSLRPLEVQPSLRGANECLSFSITHDPVPPLPMPTRPGTYLTPEINEDRVPGETNGWRSDSPVRQSNHTATENHCATTNSWTRAQAPRPPIDREFDRGTADPPPCSADGRLCPQLAPDSSLGRRRSAAISRSPSGKFWA